MKEREIGEVFRPTTSKKVYLKVAKATHNCKGCYYYNEGGGCGAKFPKCVSWERSDKKRIIYIEAKNKDMTDFEIASAAYKRETGRGVPSNQIEYHEWHMGYVKWLEKKFVNKE